MLRHSWGETIADRQAVRARVRPRRLAAVVLAAMVVVPVVASAPAEAVVWATPCIVTVHAEATWGSNEDWAGSVLTVTVTNPASTSSTSWTTTSSLANGQSLGAIWNARGSVSGGVLTVRNDTGNGALAPGASTTFGVQLFGGSRIPSFACLSDAPGPIGNTVLTEADNGRTISVVQGDTVTVRLGPDWQPPRLTGDALELISVTGGYPTGEPVEAVYRSKWGTDPTLVRSQTDYDCFHTTPGCARPIQLWSVSVRVAVPPPTAQAPA